MHDKTDSLLKLLMNCDNQENNNSNCNLENALDISELVIKWYSETDTAYIDRDGTKKEI